MDTGNWGGGIPESTVRQSSAPIHTKGEVMRRMLVLGAFTSTLMVVSGVAAAETWTRSTDGSAVTFNNNISGGNERFHVCDTSPDGNAVYVQWTYNGDSGKEEFHGGYPNCTNFDHNWLEGKTVTFKSCEDRNNWPDDCSSWENNAKS